MSSPILRTLLLILDWLAVFGVMYVLLTVVASPLIGTLAATNVTGRAIAPFAVLIVSAVAATLFNQTLRRRLSRSASDSAGRRLLNAPLVGLALLIVAIPVVLFLLSAQGRGQSAGIQTAPSPSPSAVAAKPTARPVSSGVAGVTRSPVAAAPRETPTATPPTVPPLETATATLASSTTPTATSAPTTEASVVASPIASPAGCAFPEHFGPLLAAVGAEAVGACVEAARIVQSSGNLEQRTTRGLLVWQREDNVIGFSDGAASAYRCPNGSLERRRAGEPFRCGRTVLLADDFNDPAVGSLRGNSPLPAYYESGYVGGEYALMKLAPTWPQSPGVLLPGRYADTSIRLDARLVGETDNRYVVVVCRDQGVDSNYRLTLDPAAGALSLTRWDRGRQVDLSGLQSSAAIKRGNETNHIEFLCVGPTIAALINGTQVAAVQDSTYRQGQILLLASHAASVSATVDVRFDNLLVIQS